MKLKIILLFILINCSLHSQTNNELVNEVAKEYKDYKKKSVIDTTDKRIITLLDNLFNESLQSDENKISEETIDLYKKFYSIDSLPNWHLFFLFSNYQTFISEATHNPALANPDLQLWLIKTLSSEIESIFGYVPVMVAIYQGEAFLATGRKEAAIAHFSKYGRIYPNAIPIKVYRFQIESEFDIKEKLYDDLKTNHSTHWMVKNL